MEIDFSGAGDAAASSGNWSDMAGSTAASGAASGAGNYVFNPAVDSQAAYADGSAYTTTGALDQLFNQGSSAGQAAYQPNYAAQAPDQFSFSPAKDSQQAYSDGSAFSTANTADTGGGALSQIMKGLGLSSDLSNPKNLESWMRLIMGGGGILKTLLQSNKPQNYQDPRSLAASVGGNTANSWTPMQRAAADRYFNQPATPWMSRPRAYSADMKRGYAEGGPAARIESQFNYRGPEDGGPPGEAMGGGSGGEGGQDWSPSPNQWGGNTTAQPAAPAADQTGAAPAGTGFLGASYGPTRRIDSNALDTSWRPGLTAEQQGFAPVHVASGMGGPPVTGGNPDLSYILNRSPDAWMHGLAGLNRDRPDLMQPQQDPLSGLGRGQGSPFSALASLFNRPDGQRFRAYADGGEVFSTGGDTSDAVYGHGGGQDDVVDARLAPGEFVFDADAVSALGDGNNEEGVRKLETMREAIRRHKRAAPPDKIPPRAKPITKYLPKGSI